MSELPGDAVGVGLVGLGTIGTGTARILLEHAELIRERLGHPLELVRIADLDLGSDRGIDLSGFDYYVAFSWWKMACLVEGVVARLRAGAGGGMATSSPEQVMERVDSMLERAAEAAERV